MLLVNHFHIIAPRNLDNIGVWEINIRAGQFAINK